MEMFSRSTFGVARVFMALAVFFCHVFEPFNNFGFLFVGVFFFMSGYGMEKNSYRSVALRRVVPYVLYFCWFSVLYWLLFRCDFPYPSGWFLIVYCLVMVMYRFLPRKSLLWAFVCVALLMYLSGLNWVWCASFGAFEFGVYYASRESSFKFSNCIMYLPVVPFCVFLPVALWGALPLFTWIVLKICSFRIFSSVAWLGQYTFYFYCVHCLFLGIFRSTWTLGGVAHLSGVLCAFVFSCVASWLCNDYLFRFRS